MTLQAWMAKPQEQMVVGQILLRSSAGVTMASERMLFFATNFYYYYFFCLFQEFDTFFVLFTYTQSERLRRLFFIDGFK